MIREILEELKQKKNVRQSLIQLKEVLRGNTQNARKELLLELNKDYTLLSELLEHDDPKARKNAALVIKELSVPELMPLLWNAYCQESIRFVKSAYLEALKSFDYKTLLPELKEALIKAGEIPVTEENKKHLQEEKMLLRELIQAEEKRKPHRYCNRNLLSEIVLTTNRNHKYIVMQALETAKKKEFNAGVVLQTRNPEQLFSIRCFEEMFFVLPECRSILADPIAAAEQIAAGGICQYLKARHEEDENPFLFRIEIRGSMTLEKRSSFIRKMAATLEQKTQGALVNVVSGYEIELRMVENKNGGYNLLLKLFTLPDHRFEYRQKTVSTGMRSVNAALCIALAAQEKRMDENGRPEKFFKSGAKVFDPFCGAAAMLIERAKYGRVKEIFGLDIMPEAVEAAKENARIADQPAVFFNRDFFKFAPEREFDEVVTDMPFLLTEQEEKRPELIQLYQDFFQIIPAHLSRTGIMVVYTHDKDYVRKYAVKNFKIIKELEISMKEGSSLFLLQKRQP